MKERWDIELLFLTGPQADHRPRVYKGPQVNIGSNPEVGGIRLNGVAIAPIHARIDCYDGKRVMLHPVDHHETRVASHRNEDWNRIDPIYKSVPLLDGNVVYIGPLGHGVIFEFIRAKTFELREKQISSVVDQRDQMAISLAQNTKAKTIYTSQYPKWFLPSVAGIVSVTMILLFIRILDVWSPELPPVGPRYQGYRHNLVVDLESEIETSILQGFQAPYEDFVMVHNQRESGIPNLSSNTELWDNVLYEMTVKSIQQRSYWKGFWNRLREVKSDYAMVVDSLRDAGLPEVLAGIPFQESMYKKTEISSVCAAGIWQFMPETGKRMGLDVRNCRLDLSGKLWSPTALSPPYSVARDATYVRVIEKEGRKEASCRIGNSKRGTSCEIDERVSIQKSTVAAMKLLKETYQDQELAESGSLVQATILAHNAGYDDEVYLGRVKRSNVLPAYRRYRNKYKKKKNGVHFYGDNLCPTEKSDDPTVKKCKSFLPAETQKYGYNVFAFHILAVCYYAKNYPGDPIFSKWEGYLNGYCKEVHAPDREGT